VVVVAAAVGLGLGGGLALTAVTAALKWLVVGRYRPRVEPLWSTFVRRSELITGLYEMLAAPGLLGMLRGTPLMGPALRLFGVHVGRRTWIDSTYVTEFDLVHIEDDAAIGTMCSLQTHLFEDRVMKMSAVRVEAGASVGERAVVLYDATVGAGAHLGELSLAMKGEQLPRHTAWMGIPAQAQWTQA
jgi:non-ribosomal peptide synthetase-like protein